MMPETGVGAQRRGTDSSGRRYNRIQHGQCSYTFLLPENDGNCREGAAEPHSANALQRDAPQVDQEFSTQKIQRLEHVMENYTQWLQKIENYIQENMKNEMVQIQQNAVQNHTATMLEIGTNLLSQTAEQTRKLTNVETQVLNQTTRLEIQLLENSLSTNKLEKQLLVQMNEISKLFEKNRFLENKILEMEDRHRLELETLRAEKVTFQNLVGRQSNIIQELEKQLSKATSNNSILQKQQLDLAEMVHNLINLYAKDGDTEAVPNSTEKEDEEKKFRDCADIYNAGFNKSGVYNININTLSEPKKVYCNMDVAGGGWTVIQHREDGSVDFHRIWKEYKMGFGSLSAEHWLGNEFVFLLTNQREYSLRIELTDWDGNQAFSQYDRFHIGNEKQNYRGMWKDRDDREDGHEDEGDDSHKEEGQDSHFGAAMRMRVKAAVKCKDRRVETMRDKMLIKAAVERTAIKRKNRMGVKMRKMIVSHKEEGQPKRKETSMKTREMIVMKRKDRTGMKMRKSREDSVYSGKAHHALLQTPECPPVAVRQERRANKRVVKLFLKSHSGTAGKQSSMVIHGANFSTKDADNDNCICKCALMLTGGWWFDACGPSNLNGMYYSLGQNLGKLNGIKWHYFKGPSYSLRATTMMIRPLDF
ncbi:ANGP1 protein, partial [Polypterus senegalus]|nr:ANGP1 protein [Polypterus senegalus]